MTCLADRKADNIPGQSPARLRCCLATDFEQFLSAHKLIDHRCLFRRLPGCVGDHLAQNGFPGPQPDALATRPRPGPGQHPALRCLGASRRDLRPRPRPRPRYGPGRSTVPRAPTRIRSCPGSRSGNSRPRPRRCLDPSSRPRPQRRSGSPRPRPRRSRVLALLIAVGFPGSRSRCVAGDDLHLVGGTQLLSSRDSRRFQERAGPTAPAAPQGQPPTADPLRSYRPASDWLSRARVPADQDVEVGCSGQGEGGQRAEDPDRQIAQVQPRQCAVLLVEPHSVQCV